VKTLALVSLLSLAALGLARADEPPRRLTRQISIDAEDMDLADLLAQISQRTGETILLDPDVSAKVSLTLRDVSWRIALDLIAERTRCKIRRRGDVWLLYRPADLIDLELYDANVRTVLLLLARYADKSIVIGPKVQGTITLSLRGVSALRALSAVAKTAGDYLVLPEREGSWQVAADEGAPAKKPATEPAGEEVLYEGTFVRFAEGRLELLVPGKVKGGKVKGRAPRTRRFALSAEAKLRALQTKVLGKLKAGTKLHVGARRIEGRLVVTHVVGPSR